MDGLIKQVSDLLVNPPGSLAFSLVLLFCTTTSLQVILLQLRQNQYVYKNRLLTGILILLVSQFAMFIMGIIAWQAPAAGHLFLPPLDRTVSLFGLIIIAWLWTYPEPHRQADIYVVILAALVIVFGVFTYLFWSNQQPAQAFNVSQLDQIWNIVSIVISLCLLVALWMQKPRNWPIGIYILAIHFAAFVFHYASGIITPDLAASVRLAQLLTYPFLPLLMQGVITPTLEPGKAWPLVSRVEQPSEVLTQAPPPQDSFENSSLKNQLEISNHALAEANALIENLKVENQKLTAQQPADLPKTPPPTDSAPLRMFADKISPTISNIRVNAALVKSDGVGVLGGLQRIFLNEAIELADQAYSAVKTIATHPADPQSIQINFKQNDLAAGIDSAIACINNDIRNKRITLRLDLPENPLSLTISQNILEQILIHLFENAIQVTPPEETIGLKVEEIKEGGLSTLLIQMNDSGGGVSAKNVEKIFAYHPTGSEPRYRGIGSLNSLHLAKTMVEAYGGKIWLESKAKQTTFFVQISL